MGVPLQPDARHHAPREPDRRPHRLRLQTIHHFHPGSGHQRLGVQQHDHEPGQRTVVHVALPLQLRRPPGPQRPVLARHRRQLLPDDARRAAGEQRRRRHADVVAVELYRPVPRHGADDVSDRESVAGSAYHLVGRGRDGEESDDHEDGVGGLCAELDGQWGAVEQELGGVGGCVCAGRDYGFRRWRGAVGVGDEWDSAA